MLCDPLEVADDAPQQSIRIVKPFGRDELIAAITSSEAIARRVPPQPMLKPTPA
jgi:hypothetical protein